MYWGTIGLLGLFALLNLMGLTESANVALVIFIAHMTTLALLVIFCFIYMVENPHVFSDNWNSSYWDEVSDRNFMAKFFFGFCSGLLGISGFESAANFIEEQKPGVFSKALRNMWMATGFFNTALAFLAMGVVENSQIVQYDDPSSSGEGLYVENDQLLADMAQQATKGFVEPDDRGWLSTLVSIDAVCVLSGAVLTGYVGVCGLVRRMSLDRCLPQFLNRTNKIRGTNHYIIISFFLVTSSLFIIVQGDTTTIAGVYGIAFLGVMCYFSVAAMLLKFKRSRLPRETKAPWASVVVAFLMVFAGMMGNIINVWRSSLLDSIILLFLS